MKNLPSHFLRAWVGVCIVLVVMIANLQAATPYVPHKPDPLLEPWRWRSFAALKGLGLQCLAEDNRGRMWFGLEEGVTCYDGHQWMSFTAENSIINAPVDALCVTQDGQVYIGTDWGISRFDGQTWVRHFPVDKRLPFPINSLNESRDGSLWAGTNWGALHMKQSKITLYTTQRIGAEMKGFYPNLEIVAVPEHVVPNTGWMETRGGGLGIWAAQKWANAIGRTGNAILIGVLASGGPADVAGLKFGDRIVAVDGQTDIIPSILNGKVGTTVTLEVVRQGQSLDVKIERKQVTGQFGLFPVSDILEDRDGNIWFGLRPGEIVRFKPTAKDDSWRFYSQDDGLDVGYNPHLLQSRDGVVWAISSSSAHGVNRFDGKKWTVKDVREIGGSNVSHTIVETRDGTVWIGGHKTITMYREGKWTMHKPSRLGMPNVLILDLLETSDGALWFAPRGQKAFRFAYDTEQWQSYKGIIFQCETHDGAQWFISTDNGVVRLDGQNWMRFGEEDGLITAPNAMLVAKDGTLWAAGSHNGVAATARFDGQRWEIHTHPRLSWTILPKSLSASSDGGLWFAGMGPFDKEKGHLGGLMQFDGQTWTHHVSDNLGVFVYGVAQSTDGTVWAGGYNGLHRFDGQNWLVVNKPMELRSPSVDVMHSTSKGVLWVGTRQYGVFSYDGQFWNRYDIPEGLPEGRIKHIAEFREKDIWVLTETGISHFDGTTWSPVDFSSALIPKYEGALRMSRNNLWINSVDSKWFLKEHALGLSHILKGDDLTTVRYARDPDPPNTQITVSVSEVAQLGNTVLAWEGMDKWRITENLAYAWRMNNGPWSSFSDETNLPFLALESGDYIFEVKARDGDFNEDPTPAVARFTVLPPIWQMPWFLGLASFVLLVIVFQAWRLVQSSWQLQRANAELETRVADRTQELSMANEILSEEIVERQKAQEKMQLYNRQLERSNQDLQQFASIASHDLQEPLRKVTTFADLLNSEFGKKFEGEGSVYLNYIVDAASRMQVLVKDLLAYSRVTAKADPFVSVDLNQVAQEVVSDLQIRIQETGGQVEIGDLAVIDADPLQIRQLFQNLIGNGLKFHREGVAPVVRVEGSVIEEKTGQNGRAKSYCRLEFSDNGIGFDNQYAEQMFEVFQRLHSREEYEGTGIGLALCQKIVVRHGGQIVAEGFPGEGSKFTMTLPLHQNL